MDLGDGITVRLVSAVAFVATKLEAFASRGGSDFMTSHDLEDVLNIVDGRDELIGELSEAPLELQLAVSKAFARLTAHPDFANVLPGLIADPDRTAIVLARFKRMSA